MVIHHGLSWLIPLFLNLPQVITGRSPYFNDIDDIPRVGWRGMHGAQGLVVIFSALNFLTEESGSLRGGLRVVAPTYDRAEVRRTNHQSGRGLCVHRLTPVNGSVGRGAMQRGADPVSCLHLRRCS